MKLIVILMSAIVVSLFLVACDNDNQAANKSDKKVKDRWYTTAQLNKGKEVFADNCAACHGNKGQGLVDDWRKALPDDSYPAPPLNGTAHTWHHSMEILLRTINKGGIPLGGTMPAFNEKLSEDDKEAVLAYVMSLWPNKVYMAWKKRNP